MPDAQIGGGRIHWREAGAGNAVLLLHAFPLSSVMWQPQLDTLPGDHHWIAPDTRGFGESAATGALSMDGIADDVAGLLDHLGHERATVCGVSMGGYIAFAFLRRHRERVGALVLSDTRATADDAAGKLARRISSERVRADGSAAIVAQMLERLVSPETRERRPATYAKVRAMLEQADPASFARAQAAMAARPDSSELLPTIDVPTLVVTGQVDAIIGPEVARGMSRAIPDARLEVIEGAGHLPNVERPDRFNPVLVEFIESIRS